MNQQSVINKMTKKFEDSMEEAFDTHEHVKETKIPLVL